MSWLLVSLLVALFGALVGTIRGGTLASSGSQPVGCDPLGVE